MAKYEIKDGIAIIPEGTQKIEDRAFAWCDSLTSVVIPDSVTEIGERAFFGCSALTEIKVAEGNPKYDSRKNCNAIIETARNKLIVGCKSTNIPDSVTEIGESAFSGCKRLKSVTIPNSVTEIGESAFCGCDSLASVTIPDSVTKIGRGAFDGCSGLTLTTRWKIKLIRAFGFLNFFRRRK